MAEVDTPRALLVMALQDLLDGERALIERLEAVADAARNDALAVLIGEERTRSDTQRERLDKMLKALGETSGGSPNVWLRAILDDADNDAEAIAAGPLRDIALVGALRKGKQSERVSYETALALAERLGLDEPVTQLRESRDEEQAADEALAKLLERLVSGVD